jgi:hypothetical protein
MKILSNKRYRDLLLWEKEAKKTECETCAWRDGRVEELRKENVDLALEKLREIEKLNYDHEFSAKKIENDVDFKIENARKVDVEKIARLTLENGNLKKEVEILNKAFGAVGFEVKDMKSILDKLVEGIISKNTVNVIK